MVTVLCAIFFCHGFLSFKLFPILQFFHRFFLAAGTEEIGTASGTEAVPRDVLRHRSLPECSPTPAEERGEPGPLHRPYPSRRRLGSYIIPFCRYPISGIERKCFPFSIRTASFPRLQPHLKIAAPFSLSPAPENLNLMGESF